MAAKVANSAPLWCTVAAVTAAAGIAVGAYYLIAQNHRRKPKSYVQVGQVSQLFIYPIKSCRGIEVDSALCTPLGLRQGFIRDRIFMLITENGNFVTARQEHNLLLVVPSFEGTIMLVNAPKMSTLRVSLTQLDNEKEAKLINCRVWGTAIRGYDCGDEVAKWFQMYLGKEGYRLVYFRSDLQPRFGKKSRYQKFFQKNDAAVFADLTPYLLISESSVENLNRRLENSCVTTTNFRPNISMTGSAPYDEDNWKNIRIGDSVYFRNIKPCPRCLLTTINPETAVKGKEPLKTLKSYRQPNEIQKQLDGDAPLFGVGLCVDVEGEIKIGDSIYAA